MKETKLTTRQTQWLNAAKIEAKKGNGVTAGLFYLLAQPNDEERMTVRITFHSPQGDILERFEVTDEQASLVVAYLDALLKGDI